MSDPADPTVLGPTPRPPAPPAPPTVRLGRYEILRRLGGGGMGDIFLATDTEVGRTVALKVLPRRVSDDPELVQRFHREVKILASLSHPHVCPVFGAGEEDGLHYYAMEYLEGLDLEQVLRAQRVDGPRAAEIVRQVAQALHFAHQHEVVHRDMKPKNVVLVRGAPRKPTPLGPEDGAKGAEPATSVVLAELGLTVRRPTDDVPTVLGVPPDRTLPRDGGEEASPSALPPPRDALPARSPSPDFEDHAYVIDFGLAAQSGGTRITESGRIMGTPAYMSPEQARGDNAHVGPGSDVYSMGALLYEMLTLRPPFQAHTLGTVVHLVLTEEPTRPRLIRSDVPRDLEVITLKCLEKEPARRYASALALAEDLDRWRRGEPILARPVGRAERSLRWLRRHPTAAASGALVAAFAVALLVIWSKLAGGWHKVYEADFSTAHVGADWFAFKGTCEAHDGALCLGRTGEVSIALSRAEYFGDLRLEYTARVMPDSPIVNDLSCLLLGSETGWYRTGYYFGVGGNNNTRSHLIRGGKAIVAADTEFRLERGRAYRIVVERVGPKMSLTVDGRVLYDFEDTFPIPEVEGRVGFYTESHAHISGLRISRLETAAFPDGMTVGDGHYNAGEFLAAAQSYGREAAATSDEGRRSLARLKEAAARRQFASANGGPASPQWKAASESLSTLAASAPSRRVGLEAGVLRAVMEVDEGGFESGAARFAESLRAATSANDAFLVANAFEEKADRLRAPRFAKEYERLMRAFLAGLGTEALTRIGAVRFSKLIGRVTDLMTAHDRLVEATDLARTSYRQLAESGTGEWTDRVLELLCRQGRFDEALAFQQETLADLLRARARHRGADAPPLEEDVVWGERYREAMARGVLVLCRAGRLDEARALVGEVARRGTALAAHGLAEVDRDRCAIPYRVMAALASGDPAELDAAARESDAFLRRYAVIERTKDVAEACVHALIARGEWELLSRLRAGAPQEGWRPGWSEFFATLEPWEPLTMHVFAACHTRAETLAEARADWMRRPENAEDRLYVGYTSIEEYVASSTAFDTSGRTGLPGENPWLIDMNLGLACELRGESAAARTAYERALSRMQSKVAAWYLCRRALERLKE